MSIYARPGVYVEETLTAAEPTVGAEAVSVAAFVGASDRGPIQPILIRSWNQYKTFFGGFNSITSDNLPLAVWSFFQNGGSSAYIQRALATYDPAIAVKAFNTFQDGGVSPLDRLTVTARNPGFWGNSIFIDISAADANDIYSITVYYKGTKRGNSVERFSNLSNDPNNARYVEKVINSNSHYIYVDATNNDGNSVPPASTGGVPVALTSGANGGAVTEAHIANAVTKLDIVRNTLILNPVGVVTPVYVNQVLDYAEERGDVFVIVDPAPVDNAQAQIDWAADYSYSSYGAVYYPPIVISDPTSRVPNATRLVSPVGSVIGVYVTTDTSRGVFKAPAGLSTRIMNAVSVARLSNSSLDAMNTATVPVNAIRYIPGSGIVIMGTRTFKSDYVDRYIPVRRTLIYLRKALTDLTDFAIFEPNDSRLWNNLTDVCEKFLTSFWQSGGLRGDIPDDAFYVKCDEDNNPLSSVDEGEVNIEIGVALQRPAEYVIIKIGQFEGGTTVTVE